jgi:hypothetical protein
MVAQGRIRDIVRLDLVATFIVLQPDPPARPVAVTPAAT